MRIRPENQEAIIRERMQFWQHMANNGPTMLDKQRGRHNLHMLIRRHPEIAKSLGIAKVPTPKSKSGKGRAK